MEVRAGSTGIPDKAGEVPRVSEPGVAHIRIRAGWKVLWDTSEQHQQKQQPPSWVIPRSLLQG